MKFGEETIQKVWEKAKITSGDPNIWRKDECSAWINRAKYGDRDSKYGWEIDHISPNGSDSLSNLRPLHWKNNVDKSDGRLKCNVVADGTNNVEKGENNVN